MVGAAVAGIKDKARRLLYYQLEVAQKSTLIPLEDVGRAVEGMGLNPEEPLTRGQIATLRTHLDCDLVVGGDRTGFRQGTLAVAGRRHAGRHDVGKCGLGLATSWNPGAIFGNIGFELLTSKPVWFGGGYLFGVVSRPVRVEASAWDPVNGESVWDKQEFAVYIWGRLKQLPEGERKKKEAQLYLNLKLAMEELAVSLLEEGLTVAKLGKLRRPPPPPESY